MIYYDRYDDKYVRALNSGEVVYITQIKVLNWQEQILADITDKCDLKESSINLSLVQRGVRRQGTLKLINDDGTLDVNENKWLWALRKFQIFKGVIYAGNTYLFSQGIFVLKSVSGSKEEPVITIADKYCLLNGEIKLAKTEAQLQIPSSGNLDLLTDEAIAAGNGIKFINVLRDLLQQPIGNGYMLDDKEPVCDPEFDKLYLQRQIVVSEGFYPGAAIEEIAQTAMYNAYYDTYGRLRVVRNLADDYYYLAPIFEFDDNNSSRADNSYSLDQAYNAQTVEGSNVDGIVYRYTAKNDNPRSPIRISLIGERRDSKVNISNGDSERKCEMYANYLLKRKTAPKLSISFSAAMIPHIDVDVPITKNGEKLIVQSASFPLAGGAMKISACSIDYIQFERWQNG